MLPSPVILLNRGVSRERVAGGLLAGMLVVSIVAGVAPGVVSPLLSAVFGWPALALLWPRVARRQRRLVAALLGVGLLGLLWSVLHGRPPDWELALAGNQGLIGMLLGISFLVLVAGGAEAATPTGGRAAVWRTLVGLHLFGAVINLAALHLVGDRLAGRSGLTRGEALILSRGFSTGAFWSPFWGSMGAVLTYMPSARLEVLIPVGVAMAALSLSVSAREVIRSLGARAGTYRGYPLSLTALRVPLLLCGSVLVAHLALPAVPVVTLIALLAVVVTVVLLVVRERGRTLARLGSHVMRRLPQSHGELSLFLSAGMLTAGFTSITATSGSWLPFARFTAWEAWLLLVTIVAVSLLGIHPIISIATAATLLAPLSPDPTLFAMAGLLGWGIVVAGGPLSGTNVVIQGRYGIDSFQLVRWNAVYALLMLPAALVALYACAALAGVPG